ncbi:hypothetical protein M407DRAFT_241724, partial [Tulasnella calospora MUT 4182]
MCTFPETEETCADLCDVAMQGGYGLNVAGHRATGYCAALTSERGRVGERQRTGCGKSSRDLPEMGTGAVCARQAQVRGSWKASKRSQV